MAERAQHAHQRQADGARGACNEYLHGHLRLLCFTASAGERNSTSSRIMDWMTSTLMRSCGIAPPHRRLAQEQRGVTSDLDLDCECLKTATPLITPGRKRTYPEDFETT